MSDPLVAIDSNETTALHSPIGRLSLDLLHIIFDVARHKCPAAPFTLSHVSRSWRSFVLASPLLWTSIVIGQASLGCSSYYDLWFERTQGLDLSLCIQPLNLKLTSNNRHTIFYVLAQRSRPWKELVLAGTIDHIESTFLSVMVRLIVGLFPKLRRLHIPQLNKPRGFALDYEKELPSMPHLESIAIHANTFTFSPEFLSTSARLRRIHLSYLDDVNVPIRLNSLYQIILHVSTRLQDLCIQITGGGGDSVSDNLPDGEILLLDSVSLPRLKGLNLSWGTNNSKGHLFNPLLHRLLIPNLVTLRNLPLLVLEEETFNLPLGLTHLELTGCERGEVTLSKDIIHALLQTFSHLSRLHSVRFEFITWHNGEFATVLLASCPQLVKIRLHDCSSVREGDLRRLVEGRKASKEKTSLQYLGVLNCKALKLDDETRAWFAGQLEKFEYAAGRL